MSNLTDVTERDLVKALRAIRQTAEHSPPCTLEAWPISRFYQQIRAELASKRTRLGLVNMTRYRQRKREEAKSREPVLKLQLLEALPRAAHSPRRPIG